MQSDRPPSDSSYPRDPRSIPPRRKSSSSQPKRSLSRDSDSGRSKRKDTEEDDSDFEQYNFEKLKNFQIPRKKGKGEKELLNEIPLSAREYTHAIYQTLRSSFFDPQSSRKIVINQVEVVHNEKLESEYLAKKKDMKDEGRSEKDLSDSFGYLHFFKRSEVEKVCKDGVTVGHCNLTTLGKRDMGVYICKHADIIRFSKWEDDRSGYIVMFKIIKGKAKLVTECHSQTTEQEPTPLYDCHITKLPINVVQSVHSRAYQAMQYYLYEYGDVDVVQRPRQVLPHAVLKYTYKETASIATAGARTNRRESSADEVFSDHGGGLASPTTTTLSDNGFCHWRGMLLVKNGSFCQVKMRSHLDTVFNVANIDRNINIKTCLPLQKLKRQLPPTLMSRTAKKYNVIYRGRHYNTFTLHPTEEGSGLGKFRQLIGHLVQRCAAAFIPLRNNSSLYLLPLSALTEEMGLRSSSSDIVTTPESPERSQCAWKNFLHVIIITPKALSSKINDQRVFNLVRTRKRRESQTTPMSSVRDALEQKLLQMNIDPTLALSSMEPEQQQKLYGYIKDKKKLQTSEKMLHSHYKEVDNTPSTVKALWKKKLYEKWFNVGKFQQEMYFAKKQLKVISSPSGSERKRTLSQSTNDNPAVHVAMDDNTEATFSDDEDAVSQQSRMSAYKIPKKQRLEEPAKVPLITNVPCDTEEAPRPPFRRTDPRMDHAYKPKVPIQYIPAAKPKINPTGTLPTILRPSFKPLEELIFSENLEELMKHPEFSFTEKHCTNHKVTGFATPYHSNSPYTPWEENHPPVSITFTHNIPYPLQNADCPYAFENDPIVLSMLRAIHGDYNGLEDTQEQIEQVNWVRNILHNRKASSDDSAPAPHSAGQASGMARKIVEQIEEKSSPQITEASPHMSSTDSGFVSCSAAGTPGDITIPDSPSLKDIAAIIASALTQTKTQMPKPPTPKEPEQPPPKPQETAPDMEMAAKALFEVLTQADGSGAGTGFESQLDDNMEGVDMEIGSTPEQSPVKENSQSREPDPSPSRHNEEIFVKSPLPITPQHAQGPDSMSVRSRSATRWDRPITPPPAPPSFSAPEDEDTERRGDFDGNAENDTWTHKRSSPGRDRARSSSHYENNGQGEAGWHQDSERWDDNEDHTRYSFAKRRNGDTPPVLLHRKDGHYSHGGEESPGQECWTGDGGEHKYTGTGFGERTEHRKSNHQRGHYREPRRGPEPRRGSWGAGCEWPPEVRPPGGIRRPSLLGNRPDNDDDDHYPEATHPARRRTLLGDAPDDYEDGAPQHHKTDHYPKVPPNRRVLLEHPEHSLEHPEHLAYPERDLYRHNHHSAGRPMAQIQRGRPRLSLSHQPHARPRPMLPRPRPRPMLPRPRPRPMLPRPRPLFDFHPEIRPRGLVPRPRFRRGWR